MKKLLLIGFTMLSMSAFAQSVDFGFKAGLVYNADKGAIKTTTEAIDEKGKGSMGFQGGIMARIKAGGIYVQPELLYTNFKNTFDDGGVDVDVKKSRIDLPINIGKTFAAGLVQLQTGPVFSMNFEDKIDAKGIDFPDADERDNISLGWQIGTGVNIKNLNIDLRYEFGLGKTTSKYLLDAAGTNYEFQTENRAKLLTLSVGYFF